MDELTYSAYAALMDRAIHALDLSVGESRMQAQDALALDTHQEDALFARYSATWR